jgi:hypothetical protein
MLSGSAAAASSPLLGSAYNGNLTFMGPLTTGLGGAYAGFGSYPQGC